jgi:histone H3/H4
MAEFVVKSKVQAMVKELDMRLSGDALGVIDERVQSALKKAAGRAKANGRKTIQPQDF